MTSGASVSSNTGISAHVPLIMPVVSCAANANGIT